MNILHYVSWQVVWTLVCFILEDYCLTLLHSFLDIDLKFLRFSTYSLSSAYMTVLFDSLSFASTVRTMYLLPHDHTWTHSDLLNDYTSALAMMA